MPGVLNEIVQPHAHGSTDVLRPEERQGALEAGADIGAEADLGSKRTG
jgi:hypothetical protein